LRNYLQQGVDTYGKRPYPTIAPEMKAGA
jgi:hypothetical protein